MEGEGERTTHIANKTKQSYCLQVRQLCWEKIVRKNYGSGPLFRLKKGKAIKERER